MKCSNDPPDPDFFFVTRDACEGCDVYVECQGTTFCCNKYCDIGWISVDPNTDPLCQCGHD